MHYSHSILMRIDGCPTSVTDAKQLRD